MVSLKKHVEQQLLNYFDLTSQEIKVNDTDNFVVLRLVDAIFPPHQSHQSFNLPIDQLVPIIRKRCNVLRTKIPISHPNAKPKEINVACADTLKDWSNHLYRKRKYQSWVEEWDIKVNYDRIFNFLYRPVSNTARNFEEYITPYCEEKYEDSIFHNFNTKEKYVETCISETSDLYKNVSVALKENNAYLAKLPFIANHVHQVAIDYNRDSPKIVQALEKNLSSYKEIKLYLRGITQPMLDALPMVNATEIVLGDITQPLSVGKFRNTNKLTISTASTIDFNGIPDPIANSDEQQHYVSIDGGKVESWKGINPKSYIYTKANFITNFNHLPRDQFINLIRNITEPMQDAGYGTRSYYPEEYLNTLHLFPQEMRESYDNCVKTFPSVSNIVNKKCENLWFRYNDQWNPKMMKLTEKNEPSQKLADRISEIREHAICSDLKLMDEIATNINPSIRQEFSQIKTDLDNRCAIKTNEYRILL